ncbi:hypothetical protein SEVIR_6G187033v4 [Setaria viridis]
MRTMMPRKDASASLATEGPGFLGWWSLPSSPRRPKQEARLLGSAPRCGYFLASPAARDRWWGGERFYLGLGAVWPRMRPCWARASWSRAGSKEVTLDGIAGLGLAARRARAVEDFAWVFGPIARRS